MTRPALFDFLFYMAYGKPKRAWLCRFLPHKWARRDGAGLTEGWVLVCERCGVWGFDV